MAQWVLDLYEPGVSVGERVVHAATGYLYAATTRGSPATITVTRVGDDGVVGWHTEIALPGGASASNITLAANENDTVAVACDAGSELCYVVLLDGADGNAVWQVSLPFDLQTFSATYLTKKLAVDNSGNVFVAGRKSSTSEHRICKLDVTDGSVLWTANPLPTGAAGTSIHVRSMALMSTGDLVAAFESATNGAAVHVLDAADGSLVWARGITWPSGTTRFHVATDPSDNVYAVGITGSPNSTFDIVKLDDTGAEVWIREVELTAGDAMVATGGIAADADYVYIGNYIDDGSSAVSGIVALDDSGTTAAGVSYPMPNQAFTDGAESVAAADGAVYFVTYNDPDTAGQYRAVVARIEPPDFNPATFGSSTYERVSAAFTATAGSATTSSISPTYSTDTETETAGTATIGADGDLDDELHEQDEPADALIRFASSLGPTARFGTPRWANAYPVGAWTPSTTFGTPELDYDLECQATSVAPGTAFGTPYGFQFFTPLPTHYAMGIAPTTAFGTPAANNGGYQAFSVAPATAFGAPLARERFAVGAWAPTTNLGTPTLRAHGLAAGFRSGAFGTPTLAGIYAAAGFSSTVFGEPGAALTRLSLEADSIVPTTAFGTPAMQQVHRARSLTPTARLGTPLVIQGCA